MNAGTALMKPTNFPLFFTRTPQCQSAIQPGGRNALKKEKETTKRKETNNKTISYLLLQLHLAVLTSKGILLNNQNETYCLHLQHSFHSITCKLLQAKISISKRVIL